MSSNEKEYAFIKNGKVINIAIFDNPSEDLLNIFKTEYGLDDIVIGNERAITGSDWDGVDFILPSPYPSWIYDQDNKIWIPPVPYPEADPSNENIYYSWDESSLSWVPQP